MVEVGSTTEYTGNGQPFPNWLVYDSSLFEVKLNGHPAVFIAPEPEYNEYHEGSARYSNNFYIPSRTTPIGFENNFNLFVNIDENGNIPPQPLITPDMYLNGDDGGLEMTSLDGEVDEGELTELPEGETPWGFNINKPLYLYNLDTRNMSGQPPVDYDILSYPHIRCDALNLIIVYDADYSAWRVHTGGVLINCLLEWRFKKLHDIRKSPPFLNINDINYDRTYIYRESILNPLVSLIPNISDPTKVEVHARGLVLVQYQNTGQTYPVFKGQAFVAWPDLHQQMYDRIDFIDDPSHVMVAIPKLTNGIVVARINDKPSWISLNTVPDDYDISVFNSDFGYYKSIHNYDVVSTEVDTDGVLELTNGEDTVRYIARTGMWYLVDSVDEKVTVQFAILRDESNNELQGPIIANLHYSNVFTMYMGNDTFPMTNFIAFGLINPSKSSKHIDDIAKDADKFLNHERVACQISEINIIPNFEDYNPQDFDFYVNGKLSEPMINHDVNGNVIAITYYLPDLQESISYFSSSMNVADSFDREAYRNMVSAPEGKTYFLDGARLDNLDMNPETCLFNRSLPVHFQWIYKGSIPVLEYKPLFVYVRYNKYLPVYQIGDKSNGIYVDYFYNGESKTASLSYALPIHMGPMHIASLAMKHERDLIYGWKKSKYTGPKSHIYDIEILKDTIGYPIVIREEEDVDNGADTVISPLPITFTAEELGGVGTFDIIINGQKIASNISADQIEQAFIDTEKLIVEDTGEEVPNTLLTPHVTGEMELDGVFDVYIDGELVLEDVTADDLVVATEIDEVTSITAEYVKAPEPPEPEAT